MSNEINLKIHLYNGKEEYPEGDILAIVVNKGIIEDNVHTLNCCYLQQLLDYQIYNVWDEILKVDIKDNEIFYIRKEDLITPEVIKVFTETVKNSLTNDNTKTYTEESRGIRKTFSSVP